MSLPHVVFAGPEFPYARELLSDTYPNLSIEYLPDTGQRLSAFAAEIIVPLMARIDAEYMERVDGLRLIQQWGAGLEGVDIAAATARGIAVGNVSSATSGNADSVAEWCVMAALAMSRNLKSLDGRIRAGGSWGDPPGRTLSGKTAGIIGLGGVGAALARRLSAFGMELVGITRQPTRERARTLGLQSLQGLESLHDLLRQSDFVFLCLPLLSETSQVINSTSISWMRKDAILVNAGRGGLIDEAALLDVLDMGTIVSAALDVFAREPVDLENPLLSHPSVLATPHIAAVTDTSYRGIAARMSEIVRNLADGKALEHCINWPEVGPGFYSRFFGGSLEGH